MAIFGGEFQGFPLRLRLAIYVSTGILSGLVLGFIFSLWFFIVWWIDGMPSYMPSNVSFWDVVQLYLLSGMSTGLIGGVLAPMARGYFSTGLVGILCAVPFYVMTARTMGESWHTGIELAIIMGVVLGVGFYHMWLRD